MSKIEELREHVIFYARVLIYALDDVAAYEKLRKAVRNLDDVHSQWLEEHPEALRQHQLALARRANEEPKD